MISLVRHLRIQSAAAMAAITIELLSASRASAAGSSMPWEAPLQKILESVEGPVAKIIR